jgi:hypothetical protein
MVKVCTIEEGYKIQQKGEIMSATKSWLGIPTLHQDTTAQLVTVPNVSRLTLITSL